MGENLIEVRNLKIHFKGKPNKAFSLKSQYLKAVDNVSFVIKKGETFGLVGESGSGKSTVGKSILRHYNLTGGEIYFEGSEIGHLKDKELLPFRKRMQSVFQDPYSSLDPSQTVKEIVCEPMEIHRLYTKKERAERAAQMIERVGMKPQDLLKYPHEFSGGQRQRISIARALSIHPEFVLCDEPISALDVSLQAQIVQMLKKLQEEIGLTYLFISHQLQVVQKICNHMGVMYLGNIVELSMSEKIYENPLHPYTKMLICSILVPDPRVKSLDSITHDFGVQTRDGDGCKFHGRCPYVKSRCKEEEPEYYEADKGHFVACYLYEK